MLNNKKGIVLRKIIFQKQREMFLLGVNQFLIYQIIKQQAQILRGAQLYYALVLCMHAKT